MQRHTLFLEQMRWPQVRAAIESGTTTVIVPCGAVEQHGPHLPMDTDQVVMQYGVARLLVSCFEGDAVACVTLAKMGTVGDRLLLLRVSI